MLALRPNEGRDLAIRAGGLVSDPSGYGRLGYQATMAPRKEALLKRFGVALEPGLLARLD